MLCFTYVRGPDFKAGFHFSIRAQVGEFQLGLVCVGISGGNLSRLPGSTRVGTWVPTLPRSLRSTFSSGETVKGTCVSWKRILDYNIPLGNRCKSRLQGDVQVDSTQQEVEKYLALRAGKLQSDITPGSGSSSEAGESDTESDCGSCAGEELGD